MTDQRARPVVDRRRFPVVTTIAERPSPPWPPLVESDNVVYVVVDGPSNASRSAALWAADDARRRGIALCLVCLDTSAPTGRGAEMRGLSMNVGGARAGHSVPQGLVDAVVAEFPELEVRSAISTGTPVEALHRAAQRGLLTVVGSHVSLQSTDVTLGSIAAGAVARGSGPVVVVRDDPETGTVRGPGPIVVGLDGSADSDCALAFALEEADLRGRVVFAVHCEDPGSAGTEEAPGDRSPDGEGHRALDDQVAGWRDRYPDVVLTRMVLCGPPAAALLNFCTFDGHIQPGLLVVGSSRRGGLAGPLLGSTSRAVIARAPCPVAVVSRRCGRHTAAVH
jgi:nucleotide-binding universal stress UspA family protein